MKKATALALLLASASASADFQKSDTDKWFICEDYARTITTSQLMIESSAEAIREILKSGKKPSVAQVEMDQDTEEWAIKTIAQRLTMYRQLDCPVSAVITGMACANDVAVTSSGLSANEKHAKLTHCFSLIMKDIQADAR